MRRRRSIGRFGLGAFAALGVLLFALPLLGLLLRTPWGSLLALLQEPSVRSAMLLSLQSSGLALLLAATLGLPMAVWLANGRSPLRTVARIVVMLPIVLPPVTAGIALLLAFGRNGVVGAWLAEWFGVTIPFTTFATVVAAAYMGMPFFVLSVEAGLRGFDRRYLEVAATLGAGPLRRFVTVTLPMVLPSLRTGVLLCWARALGEYCATQTFAGNLEGTTRTMPLACGVAMETQPDIAVALSVILVSVSVGVLFVLRNGLGSFPMTLVLHGELQRGTFAARFDLEVAAGETLALVGPNGAGKSSCLQVLAGLVPLDRGELSLGGQRLDAPADGVRVPPEQRGVGYLPQEPLLFPHRSVLDNVAFGLRARGVGKGAARAEALEWLGRVGIADLAQRRPRELSGGQAQRAALARALAPAPRLLLLDEPLAAVDASARLALRQELARHLSSFAGPRVLVTHDAVDAFVLADRIAVLEQGRVVQVGTATEIGQRPRSRYVADLVGLNFLRGSVHDSVFTADGVPADGNPAARGAAPPAATLVVATTHEGPAIATVHPRAIALFRERPSGSPRNVWQARVVGVEVVPTGRRVRLAGPIPLVAEVTAAAVQELALGTGALVWIALKATEVQIGEA